MVGTSPPSLQTGTFPNTEAPFGPLTETPQTTAEAFISSLMAMYNTMTGSTATPPNTSCYANCSGRGECMDGTCFCLVQYEGENCLEPNVAYFASFSVIFFFIAAISLGQLVVCVRAEYQRLKTPSLRRACCVTTQKMLYFITFVAAAIRGAYFSSPSNAELTLASSFLSSFYPVILSAGSLIVCFWAEVFHLQDVRCERPRFLGKSFLGFVIFNVITYSLFLAEVFLQRATTSEEERSFLTHVFNGCYAVLMFIMVVFFLIYGVEVYFKVRMGQAASRREERGIDQSQLSQSRFGLVFQACMLMITVCFLLSDVLGGFWKNRVPLPSRNAYDIVFRVVELGVALWFPCVLWNCIAPEQLWILNPRKIFKIDIDKTVTVASSQNTQQEDSVSTDSSRECWICYDSDPSAGPLIEPCLCSGDVASVHHNCLRTWLMECAASSQGTGPQPHLSCKVCRADYQLETSPNWWIGKGFTARHWLHTASLVTVMCCTIAAAWAVMQVYQDALVRSITAGALLLIIYVCLRFLGFNTFTAYQRARYSAVKILGRHFPSSSSNNGGAVSPSTSVSSVATTTSGVSSSDCSPPPVATITGTQVALDITPPPLHVRA